MKRRFIVLCLLVGLLAISVLPNYAQSNPDIISFTSSFRSVGRQALQTRTARVPVSWATVNRPLTATLVFEQVFADGTTINVELPRRIPWVNSSGEGIAAPILPPGNPQSIVLRVTLVGIFNKVVYDQAEITMPIVSGNSGAGSSPVPTITAFSANVTEVDPIQLRNQTARIPVSWAVVNRPLTSQLYFEQVFSDGTFANVELPRPYAWVNSSDVGVVAPLSDGNASTITLRLRLVDLLFNRVLDQRVITVPIQMSINVPVINSFSSSMTYIASSIVQTGNARIDVTWSVSNRPNNSNLVFEQVFPNGTTRNAELPRDFVIVASSGNGIVAPIMPDGNPSFLVFQVRLVDLSNNQTLATARLEIPISYSSTGYTVVTADACYRPPFAPSQGISVGGQGRIQSTYNGATVTIWNNLEMTGIAGNLTSGTTFTITAAPNCSYYDDGQFQASHRLWPVFANGVQGWLDEYAGNARDGFVYNFVPATSSDIPRVDILSFTLSPSSVDASATDTTYITFRWQTNNASRVFITGLYGAAYENLPTSGEIRILARDLAATSNPMIYTLNAYDRQLNSDMVEVTLSFNSNVSINSFEIVPTTARANTAVTLTWDIRGDFESATIWWVPNMARPEITTLTAVSSNSGNYSFTLPDWIAGTHPITLSVTDESGTAQTMNVSVNVTCAYDWGLDVEDTDCPRSTLISHTAAHQRFERGFIVWLPIDEQSLWVFYNNGTVNRYTDTWNNSDYTTDPPPPNGFVAPQRGFGYLWNNHAEVRSGLGWATIPEQGYTTQFQQTLSQGRYDEHRWYLTLPDGRILKVTYNITVSGLRWE